MTELFSLRLSGEVVPEAAEAVTETAAQVTDTTTEVVKEATHLIIPSFLQGYVDRFIETAVVAILAFIVVKLVLGALNHLMERMGVEHTLQKFVRNVARFVAYFLMALVIAGQLGINTSSVVALASVLSAAFALAAQGALGNLFGGILLLLTKPFHAGDYVEAGANSGTVQAVGLAYTVLVTPDNKVIHVPNSDIAAARIINYNGKDTRRVELKVTAGYDSPIQTVKDTINALIAADGRIHADPAPFVTVSNYGPSSIEYTVRVWCAAGDYWGVYFELMNQLKPAFDAAGVEMTYDHVNVHIVDKK
jgi:small conductance mechanosensitive channel